MRNFLPKEERKSEPRRFIVRIVGRLAGDGVKAMPKKPGWHPLGKARKSAGPAYKSA
jgi:hypothetical protein